MYNSYEIGGTKPCWQEEGTLCHAPSDTNPCADCHPDTVEVQPGAIETKPHSKAKMQGSEELKADSNSEISWKQHTIR